jgi:predicted component of type VI protein secretion system
MATLIIQTGKHKGREITIPAKEVLIGRDEGCYIRLASNEASRQHCSLRATPQGIVVRDLSSRNGTLVNEQPIHGETLLGPGDVLRIGAIEFEVPGGKRANNAAGLDDTIAEWLTDGDTSNGQPLESGTKVSLDGQSAARTPPPSTHELKVPVFNPPPRERREFRTTAEEAQDIIRRHLESLE